MTNKIKKIISYAVSGIIGILFIAMFAAPEINHYFKDRGLPSDGDLKAAAIKKFDQYKVPGDEDSQRITFADLGSTKFPYSMDYKYFLDSSVNDEKLYLYSQAQEDWILVSETKRTFDNQKLNEVSDWNALTP